MKNRLLVLLFICASLVYLSSCKKDKEDDPMAVPFPKEQDVEADKDKLELNAQLAVAELNSFSDEKGLEAINSFADVLSNAGSQTAYAPAANNNLVFSTVYKLKAASIKSNPREVFRSINSFMLEDPQSFKEVWDSIKGIYTWNPAINDWNRTNSTTVAEFHFPAKKGGTTNNAVFTISSYKGITITTPVPSEDLPTEIKANLKVDNVEYFAYNLSATYNNQGIPSRVLTSVSFRTFVFTFEFTNSTSNVAINYKFTNGSKIIFDIGSGINGNFSQQNIENSASVDQVLQSANAHFQLFNVKLAGVMNVAQIVQAEKSIYANEYDSNFDDEAAGISMANEVNKNMQIIAFFTDTKQKIANVEAYSVTKPYTYNEWVGFDPETYEDIYEEVTETRTSMEMRLVFAAGNSPSDVENYFGVGFSGLVADINSLLVELNTKFGSEFTPIVYE